MSLVNSGINQPNLTKFVRNAEKILQFNLLEFEIRIGMPVRRMKVYRPI